MIPQAYPLYAVDKAGYAHLVIGWQLHSEHGVLTPFLARTGTAPPGPVAPTSVVVAAGLRYTDAPPALALPERAAPDDQTVVMPAVRRERDAYPPINWPYNS